MHRNVDKKRALKRKATHNNDLLNSEKRSRTYSQEYSDTNSKVRFLLPTKEKNTLTYRAVREKRSEDNRQSIAKSVVQNGTDEIDRPLTTTELIWTRDHLLKLRKEKIASICSRLIEEPYSQCKLLPSLIPFCTEQESVIAVTVRKLGLLSTLAVVKDIMPGYKVREEYEEEGQGKMVSKEVKQARTFESTFLSFYQLYLNILQLYLTHKVPKTASAKTRSLLSQIVSISSEGRRELSIVAIQCVSELLIEKPHFNFSCNLVNMVVGQLANETPNRRTARDCLVRLFQSDLVGETSYEVMRRLADVIKKKNYKLSPIVLQPLLHLPLGQDATGALTSSDTPDDYHTRKFGMSRKEKKISKLKRRVERDKRETRAGESRTYISQVRSKIANIVFSIYLHILKLERSGPLLSPALEGVSHFSHVISVEYFFDLLRYLSELLSSPSSNLSFKQRLFSLHTSCTVLFSQKTQDINVDPKAVCQEMYRLLLELPVEVAWETGNLLVETLQLMLGNSQCMHQERSLGFAKRICTSSLVKSSAMTAGLLYSLRSLLKKDYTSDNLLSNESLAGACYKPELNDPDMCDAKSSCLWELCLFSSHYHPVVSKLGECLSEGSALVGKRNSLKLASDKYRTAREIMEATSHLHTDPFDGLTMCEQVESKKRKERVVKKFHTNLSTELLTNSKCETVVRKGKENLDFHLALSS